MYKTVKRRLACHHKAYIFLISIYDRLDFLTLSVIQATVNFFIAQRRVSNNRSQPTVSIVTCYYAGDVAALQLRNVCGVLSYMLVTAIGRAVHL